MKVAVVYDRVNKWGGAERILLVLHEMFPNAPLYTSVYNSVTAPWAKVFPKVIPSFIQYIPTAKQNHERFAPLMPLAFESFSARGGFDEYDLVISVTSEAAKGIVTKPKTRHICYCLTPTRYLWSHHNLYFQNNILKTSSSPLVNYLRSWDKVAAQRPDVIIAISTAVQKRIRKYYDREAKIVFPSVEIPRYARNDSGGLPISDYYLVVSRLVKYKRVDLAIKAFNKLGLPLVVVGSGREKQRLKSFAKRNVKFVKNLTDGQLALYYKNARALIMPQEEDFGLVAAETQSFGKPVIGYQAGGALDIIIDGETGVFFREQTVESLTKAIDKVQNIKFNAKTIQNNAKKFSKERFKKEFTKLIKKI